MYSRKKHSLLDSITSPAPCCAPTCFHTLLCAPRNICLSPNLYPAPSYSRFSVVRRRNPLWLAQRQEGQPSQVLAPAPCLSQGPLDPCHWPASVHLLLIVLCRLASLALQGSCSPITSACTLLCLETVPALPSILYHFSAQLPTAD